MSAVYRKEIRCYRITMPAYIFVAFILAVTGLYFSFLNLNMVSPKFETVLQNIQFVYLVFVPMLTMRVMAEEKRQKTDQLLLTMPVKIRDIVLGKYLALVTVFGAAMLIVCLYPLILTRFGTINLKAAYLAVLGFFCLGCAELAIGLFFSSLTESPVISAVMCFGFLLVCYLMNSVSRLIPGTAKASMICFLVLAVCLGIIVFRMTGNAAASFVVSVLLAGGVLLVYQMKAPLLEGLFPRLLQVLYLNGSLTGFFQGILDLPAIVYDMSIVILALWFAGGRQDSRRSTGLYRILMSVIMIAAVVLANMIARALPADITAPDFSTSRLYTLTDTTEDFLDTLDQDVYLDFICEAGEEDDNVTRLLDRYEDAGSFIHVKQIDPAVYPGYVTQYSESRVASNSIIVRSADRSQVVYAENLYSVGTSQMTGRAVETAFRAEGLLTSAIGYVVSTDARILYALNSNGEAALADVFLDAVQKNNIEVKTLNLIAEEGVPEDADAILMNASQTDYSDEVTRKILDYLEKGGKAVLLSNYSLEERPNLDAILSNYGMRRVDGIILEGDSSRYVTYQYCVIPAVNYTDITENVYENAYLLMPMCQGIEETDKLRSSITLQPLLTSSDSSYSKVDVQNMTTAEKEEKDIDGPFTIGMQAFEDVDQDGENDTRLVYFSTGYLLDADYNASVSGTNARLFGDTINSLCTDGRNSAVVSARNLQVQYLMIDSFSANFWTVICVFLIPAAVILCGLRTWMVRRRR